MTPEAYQVTGNRAVVQVFEGTSGIDVKKVGKSMVCEEETASDNILRPRWSSLATI